MNHNAMRNIIFFLLLTFVFACKEQPKGNSTNTDSTASEHAGTGGGMMGLPGDHEFDAVVVGSGVRSRQTPDTKGAVLRAFTQGELIKVIETSTERSNIDGKETCDKYGFPWCKVRDHEGKESWIYGKFVFKFQQMRSQNGRVVGDQELSLLGQPHTLHLAADQAENGMPTGELNDCQRVYLPLLIENGKHVAKLFYLNPKTNTDPEMVKRSNGFPTVLLLFYTGGDTGFDELEEVHSLNKETAVQIEVNHYHPDGRTPASIVASVSKERVDVVEYTPGVTQM